MARSIWVLRLPAKAKILVSAGDQVSAGDKIAKKGKRDYFAPVAGKIVRVEKGKIELQFIAKKIDGQGLGSGHCWGEVVDLGNQDFTRLNISQQGKIVFLEKIDPLIIRKARALAIKGLIGVKFKGKVKNDLVLPILLVPEKRKLTLALEGAKGVKCLLDANQGYLLIPRK